MPMVLVPLEGGRPIPIDKAIIFFGRSPDCDVVLTSSRKVSRKHCCVAQIDSNFIVRDLGSMNGVRVNETLVESEMRLTVGDELWVGDLGYRFQPLSQVSLNAVADEKPQVKKKRDVPQISPDLLSQDLPVALPDIEGQEFRVEESFPQRSIPDDEIIELSDDDLLDDD